MKEPDETGLPNAGQVLRELDQILDEQPDTGVFRSVENGLIEPPSPFDPDCRRRLKPEVLIVLSYVVLMGAIFALFIWT